MSQKMKWTIYSLLIIIVLTAVFVIRYKVEYDSENHTEEQPKISIQDLIATNPTNWKQTLFDTTYTKNESVIENIQPDITDNELMYKYTHSKYFTEFDDLGRCGMVYAFIDEAIMPADGEKRESIGMVKPSGWHTYKFPDKISDLYLYNRCHLLGWQLTRENANELNLITGTRNLNLTMLKYENQIRDFVLNSDEKVLLVVEPLFKDNELVARYLCINAVSTANGKITDSLNIDIVIPNIQEGIAINYATGEATEN